MNIVPPSKKPVIGVTCGDLNGIGPELIIKTFSDARLLEFCTPVIFANNKVINFYKKGIEGANITFTIIKDFSRINHKQVNLLNVWEEEVPIVAGELNEQGGSYAVKSLLAASEAARNGDIQMIVTAPIHKKNVYSEGFPFTGHTPYLKHFFGAKDVVMLMVAGGFRVGLVTEHVPVKEISQNITRELILSKLLILHAALKKDFNIIKPKIAVLALNPHAGDDGLIGDEEETIIKPAIRDGKQRDMLVFGPFAADAFFARGAYREFDAILAMYHDQGLIPFKSLAFEEGVNFTAGLEIVRVSPDHGTAFDIAGKNMADAASFTASLFCGLDILNNRNRYAEEHANPLKKMSESVIRSHGDS
ncbi:MAG: 4-hydroxythreonine-4-phosphate dehydrogenase PdxA [Ginsengibacter sp.]